MSGVEKLFIAESSIRTFSEFQLVNDELIHHLSRHPHLLREITPRKFEELVATLFKAQGFSVELTPQSRDGGRDIHAIEKSSLGTSLYLIECKRYSSTNKVGVERVRALYGVLSSERATKGILATTSSFTRDAIDFAKPIEYQLSLKDFEDLKLWLANHNNLKKPLE